MACLWLLDLASGDQAVEALKRILGVLGMLTLALWVIVAVSGRGRPRAEPAVPLSLTIQLVLAAIALLAFGFGSTANALRFLTGGASLLVAVASSAATVGLFWLGQKAHWTSDGPGMLFVMIALVVCAIVAVVAWIFVFGVAATAAVPGRALGEALRAPRGCSAWSASRSSRSPR